MTVFADSSALVKLYADEPNAEHIRAIETFVASALIRVEVPSALWRKCRMGEFTTADARRLIDEFEVDFFGSVDTAPRFVSIAPTPPILDSAAHLCAVHGLRAYDSVQLSSALAVRDADAGCHEFAAFDTQLRDAAAAEGFQLVP